MDFNESSTWRYVTQIENRNDPADGSIVGSFDGDDGRSSIIFITRNLRRALVMNDGIVKENKRPWGE